MRQPSSIRSLIIKIRSNAMSAHPSILKNYAPNNSHWHTPVPDNITTSRATALIRLFATHGYSVKELLSGTDISYQELSRSRICVSLSQFQTLIKNAYRINENHSFAAKLGEQSFINNGNLLTSRVMHSETVREAIALLIKYQSLLNDALTLTCIRTTKGVLLKVNANEIESDCLPYFVEHTFAEIYALGKLCLGQSDLSVMHDFSYSAPKNQRYFKRYFAPNLNFDQAYNQAFLPNSLLDKPLLFSDELLASRRDQQCKDRVREINSKHDILHKVRQVIRAQALDTLSHETLSEELCISPRTLRRQLSARGSSYSQLLEEERKKLAISSISQQTISLEKLAEKLGYRDQSSFSRAFKRWFGVSPKNFTEPKK